MIFPSVRLLRQAASIVYRQQQLIVAAHQENERLRAEKDAIELAYQRIGRDLIEQFLIALDTPENNDFFRDRLRTSLDFYRDEIATREEHSV